MRVPDSENVEFVRREKVLRRRRQLNANGNEVLDTISVSHRSYDPLFYILLFQLLLTDGIQRKELAKSEEQGGTKLLLPCSSHGIYSCTRTNIAPFCDCVV